MGTLIETLRRWWNSAGVFYFRTQFVASFQEGYLRQTPRS